LEHDPHRPRSHGFRCQQGRQVFGQFFSKPPEFADRSWDDACPELPSAIHDAPGTGRRQKLPPCAPVAGPAQPESATNPPLHRQALVLPKAAGTPVLPLHSSVCVSVCVAARYTAHVATGVWWNTGIQYSEHPGLAPRWPRVVNGSVGLTMFW
jgi:hypothetical protein